MGTPPILVKAAKEIWNCEWNVLMNGLAPADSKGNYKRPKNIQPEIQIPTKDEERKRTWEDKENQLRFMTTSGFTHSDSHLDQQQIKNKKNAKKVLELATKFRKQDWQGMRIDR